MPPDLSRERALDGRVAGVDEAGRGPWAGPVFAAAVVWRDDARMPKKIDDSKKLTAEMRETLYLKIEEQAWIGIGVSEVAEIDSLNILNATKLAMQRAVAALAVQPDAVLVDGNQPPKFPVPTYAIIKGDALSLSIAAASIIAKVSRDRHMAELHAQYPHYGWLKNAGYGTASHQRALAEHGVTPHHRRSFAPIRKLLYGEAA